MSRNIRSVTGVLVLEELVLGLKFPTEILVHRTISTRNFFSVNQLSKQPATTFVSVAPSRLKRQTSKASLPNQFDSLPLVVVCYFAASPSLRLLNTSTPWKKQPKRTFALSVLTPLWTKEKTGAFKTPYSAKATVSVGCIAAVAGQQAAITAQQADIACLQECMNALTSEVRALKATVAVMQAEPPLNSASTSPTGQAKEWSVVVSKGNGNGRKGKGKRQRGCPSACSEPPSQNNTQASSEETASTATTTTSAKSRSENKVKVTGARRIWGTLRSSNVKSIKSVIARICKIG